MKRLIGICISGLGLLFTAPFLVLIILLLFGVVSNLGPTIPNVTRHFTLSNLGSLTFNGEAAVPGWVTQVVSVLLAVFGVLLMIRGVRFACVKKSSSEGN